MLVVALGDVSVLYQPATLKHECRFMKGSPVVIGFEHDVVISVLGFQISSADVSGSVTVRAVSTGEEEAG